MRHSVETHERPYPGTSRSQTSRPWAAQSIRMTNINIVSDDLGYLIRCARPSLDCSQYGRCKMFRSVARLLRNGGRTLEFSLPTASC
jgi:hypothetical protein